ncbi:MAG: hypothetical protein LH631_11860 [Alkalinema sp. CAN_BIN05]|nr:hypothetical protein [Alkalinema sp. CAN_BIN05]
MNLSFQVDSRLVLRLNEPKFDAVNLADRPLAYILDILIFAGILKQLANAGQAIVNARAQIFEQGSGKV